MKSYATSTGALAAMRRLLADADTAADTPDPVVEWLARLRLLEGVPFAYLIPHDELLPPESIRFFYVNRNWTDAAIDGALSLGAVTSRDREQLAAAAEKVRDAVDQAERTVRAVEEPATGPAGVVTGFLLRSRAVSGWPGLEVHADRRADGAVARMRFLRFERLAPAVLLVLIDGIPDGVRIEEPRQGIQFGVDTRTDGGADVPLKHPDTAEQLSGSELAANIPFVDGADLSVPFRRGSPGVVHVTALAARLRQAELRGGRRLLTDTGASDQFAVQMLQFPYVQPFESAGGGTGWFEATLPLQLVVASHGG